MSINPQTNSINQPKGGSKDSEKLLTTGAEHRTRSKGGRPPKAKEEKLCQYVKVYFDDATIKQLKRLERRQGKPLSEICRNFILQGYNVEPMTKEQTSYIRKLAGMATNLNQLAHESHIQFTEDLAKRVSALADRIDEVLIWFSNKITHG